MHKTRIDSSLYDHKYFENFCGGHEEYKDNVVTPWTSFAIQLAGIETNDIVLDIGCGRGEVIHQVALLGAKAIGLDYSAAALRIAYNQQKDAGINEKTYDLIRGDAIRPPFTDGCFDVIFMMDIVEHLYPDEVEAAFTQVRRLLKPGGKIVVHTVPNANYYRYVYPVYRFIKRLVGQNLPKNPRERVYHGHVHVNEQTVKNLRKALIKSGFHSLKTFAKQLTGSKLKRWISSVLVLRFLLANDMFAVAKK